MHENRRFSISDVLQDELPNKLVNHSWTCCTGFRCGPFLFLNDATSEDGAQEYAVVREEDGLQVESVTFSWCSLDEAIKIIDRIFADEKKGESEPYANVKVLTHPNNISCRLCA
jgi:hypothetical protein